MTQPLNRWPASMKPGDLILTRGNGWLSRSIRWFGRRATGDCRINHTAIYAGNINGRHCVIEEVGKLRIAPLSVYEDMPCVVYQMHGLTDDQRQAILDKLLPVVGQAYGWGKIPLFALDSLCQGVARWFKKDATCYFFTRVFGITAFKVCSQAAAWAYDKTLGRDTFGRNWRSVSPDAQDEWCCINREWTTLLDSLAADGSQSWSPQIAPVQSSRIP